MRLSSISTGLRVTSYKVVSSAKSLQARASINAKSLMKMRNKRGPKTEP